MKKTLLQLNTSIYSENGESTRLAEEFVARWRQADPGATIIALVEELERADVIVLGLPMYNFGVPSTLKAYFDHIARAGVTFRYTRKGPVGLLTGKKAYVFATRGGLYAGTPNDTQTSYIRQFLGFLGIADVEFVYAEGMAISEASKAAALAQATRTIERLNGLQREPIAA